MNPWGHGHQASSGPSATPPAVYKIAMKNEQIY